MIGQTISHYRIEAKVGQGGMGVVYRARDTRLNRTVALKMLLPELAADAGLRRRLATEARAASVLNHPVIATVYDYEEAGDSAFIVYEYVEGTTLREVLRSRSLPPAELLSIAIRVADGLAAAHEAGVVHRDIKPDNVMITEAGRVKILDFGLAKLRPPGGALSGLSGENAAATAATATTEPGLLVGTVNYMSPEQLESEHVDRRSDVFSFGVTLYELAARQHPFAGKTPISTISNILKDEPPELSRWTPHAPAELERVIRKCLRKARGERYQSTRDLVVDLEAVRRELSGVSAAPERTGAEEFSMSRGVARALAAAIQAGYLAMYITALVLADRVESRGPAVFVSLLVTAICGIPVRLYLLAGLGLDHPRLGPNFRRLFPPLFVLDMLWAAAPLLLASKIGYGAALGSVAALAYLPFSQRWLIQQISPKSQVQSPKSSAQR